MILQALVKQYENLERQGKVSGWAGVRPKCHTNLICQKMETFLGSYFAEDRRNAR